MSSKKVGVLALQGAFAKHISLLRTFGIVAVEVRKPEELLACDALIIPGGESTTMKKRIDFIELSKPLHAFAKQKPIFGTCAGLILMSSNVIDQSVDPFGFIDIDAERNGFGRQSESFSTTIDFQKTQAQAVFIRAPRIKRCGPEVEILASYKGEPILVRQGHHLAATFHPELTADTAIHRYFLNFSRA